MSGQGREHRSGLGSGARSGAARGTERGALRRVTVPGPQPYEVVIGPGAQAELGLVLAGTAKVAVVHAPPLAAMAGGAVETLQTAGVAAEAVVVPDGEAAKTAEVAAGLWEEFGRLGLTRSDAVVGLGGGAVTDLAGFAAATWTRGVRIVQVPTSVLGMVDAAVGGKTGINTAAGKNLVGSFHPPAAVLADTDALAGLPAAEFRSGLAEVVKCGFIADAAVLDLLDVDPTGRAATEELIERAVQVKADAVADDLYDRGRREFLNYGHTLGHAIERVEDFGWRHGEAVAVGMVFAAELGGQAGLLTRAEVDRHHALIGAMGLPTHYTGDWATIQSVMRVDKKARGASLRFVVLDGLGNPRILTDPDQAWLDAAWAVVSGDHP
jgi:3-dehydroquinate synthase